MPHRARGAQSRDFGFVRQQGRTVQQDVFGESVRQLAGRVFAIALVHRVRKPEFRAVLGNERDAEVACVDQVIHDAVDGRIELFELIGAAGQLGDPEQRRLQALAALPFQHFLLQHVVGLAEREGALLDPAFQIDVRQAARQRGLDVLGHVDEQGFVLLVVMVGLVVTLHHHATGHFVAVQQGRAQPVFERGADDVERPVDLSGHRIRRTHQRLALADHVPRRAMADIRHREIAVRKRELRVDRIRIVRKPHGIPLRVIQDDVEVLGVHQRRDDLVQGPEHRGEIGAGGAGLVGDRIQRALQAFGFAELFDPRTSRRESVICSGPPSMCAEGRTSCRSRRSITAPVIRAVSNALAVATTESRSGAAHRLPLACSSAVAGGAVWPAGMLLGRR